jgi:hypothetical protein
MPGCRFDRLKQCVFAYSLIEESPLTVSARPCAPARHQCAVAGAPRDAADRH